MVLCFSPPGSGCSLQTAASGRSHWNDVEKVCTSVNLSKACRKHEELGGYRGPGGCAQGRVGGAGGAGEQCGILAGASEGGVSAGDTREVPDVPSAVLQSLAVLRTTSGTKDVSCPTVLKVPAGKTSTRDGAGMAQTPGWSLERDAFQNNPYLARRGSR